MVLCDGFCALGLFGNVQSLALYFLDMLSGFLVPVVTISQTWSCSCQHQVHFLMCAQVFACTVGQKPSKAPFYVSDTAEVSSILSRLAQPVSVSP